METTSLADAKNRLSELINAVHGTWERVTITKNGKSVAVLIAVEDLDSLTETLAVLSDPLKTTLHPQFVQTRRLVTQR